MKETMNCNMKKKNNFLHQRQKIFFFIFIGMPNIDIFLFMYENYLNFFSVNHPNLQANQMDLKIVIPIENHLSIPLTRHIAPMTEFVQLQLTRDFH
uniref:CSON010205 protein n=1 Tax=Culicoides sonorensis TaxID=179676 RepID=A0A336N373_CULSO